MLGFHGISVWPISTIENSVTMTVDAAGAASVAGQSALFTHTMALSNGAVAVAGQDLPLTPTLNAATAGEVSIAGQDTLFSLTFVASNGAVSIDGQTLPLTVSLGVDTSGTITVTGQDALFVASLILGAGSVSIDGQVVTLSYLNPSVIRRALAIRGAGGGRGSYWRGRAN